MAVGLAVAVLLAFSPLRESGFLNFDDDKMFLQNSQVNSGLSVTGIRWAFTSTVGGNWHPLTWISHQLDWTIFGGNPQGHHLTNVLIHTASTLLLFGLLLRLTANFWRCALVAALFGLHPLHVESVAWIAERKDLLCGLFWMLSIWAYRRYAARPTRGRYATLLCTFTLSLMAKPMAVTLPCVLLLLDFWPLGRERAGWKRLLAEKAPLLLLSVVFSAVTIKAQYAVGAGIFGAALPIVVRIGNALLSIAGYLRQTFWPSGLAVFYPHPSTASVAVIVVGVALLAFACLVTSVRRRTSPYSLTGWYWYLGTLVPVLGLVQVGTQARADRYTYLPLIGVFIALSWGLAAAVHGRRRLAIAAGIAAVPLLATLGCLSFRQAGFWRTSVALFEHTLAVTGESAVAHNNLGSAYLVAGRTGEARAHFEAALALAPDHYTSRANLGLILLKEGRPEEAARHFRALLPTHMNDPLLHTNLGDALFLSGRYEEAARSYRSALALAPGNAKVRAILDLAEARARGEAR